MFATGHKRRSLREISAVRFTPMTGHLQPLWFLPTRAIIGRWDMRCSSFGVALRDCRLIRFCRYSQAVSTKPPTAAENLRQIGVVEADSRLAFFSAGVVASAVFRAGVSTLATLILAAAAR